MIRKADGQSRFLNHANIYVAALIVGACTMFSIAVNEALAAKGTVDDPIPISPPKTITGILQGKKAKKFFKFDHPGECAKVWMINQSAGHMVVALWTLTGGKLASKITLSTSNNFGGSGISQRVPAGPYLASVQLAYNWDAGSYAFRISHEPC